MRAGVNFSFNLAGNSGAALVTKDLTRRKNTRLYGVFDKYTDHHYDSWVTFARNKGYGDVQPVLVYGVDMTNDFAMVTYSYQDVSLEASLDIDSPIIISASTSFRVALHTQYSPHTNYGPQGSTPSPERAPDTTSLQPTGETTSRAFDQCVFVRYYTKRARGRLWPFPRVIKANAGPHDLGPGDNTGGASPALVVQPGTETTDDGGVEPNVVVRNMPDVWFPSIVLSLL